MDSMLFVREAMNGRPPGFYYFIHQKRKMYAKEI